MHLFVNLWILIKKAHLGKQKWQTGEKGSTRRRKGGLVWGCKWWNRKFDGGLESQMDHKPLRVWETRTRARTHTHADALWCGHIEGADLTDGWTGAVYAGAGCLRGRCTFQNQTFLTWWKISPMFSRHLLVTLQLLLTHTHVHYGPSPPSEPIFKNPKPQFRHYRNSFQALLGFFRWRVRLLVLEVDELKSAYFSSALRWRGVTNTTLHLQNLAIKGTEVLIL